MLNVIYDCIRCVRYERASRRGHRPLWQRLSFVRRKQQSWRES